MRIWGNGMRGVVRVSVWVGAASISGAAWANGIVDSLSAGATAIPEPGDLALFVLGVAGLMIGRRASRIRQDRKRRKLDP